MTDMSNDYIKDKPIDVSTDTDRILLDGVERELYDFVDEEREEDFYRINEGLTEEIVRKISEEKHDPEWIAELIKSGTRGDAGESVPGNALFLNKVEYP